MTAVTELFSSRVENYIRYRPSYPPALLGHLKQDCGFTEAAVVADVGSGTGKLAEMFLRNGNKVYGVEPNREMREAGERLLKEYDGFKSVSGMAEDTTLTEASVEYVTVGQSLHWFDLDRARVEFRRILKPGGWVVVVWNKRREASDSFGREYGKLVRTFGRNFEMENHRRLDRTALCRFFGGDFRFQEFNNLHRFDFEGLKGRLLSSSYSPESGHPNHIPMLSQLRRIFDAHQVNGKVTFEYETRVYYGHLR